MALLISAIYDLEGSGRTELTGRYLESLLQTVDFTKHRLILLDNNSCQATKNILHDFDAKFYGNPSLPRRSLLIIDNPTNLGTAKAINQGLQLRGAGENAIKCDNDVVFGSADWIGEMEEAIAREPKIGILGLKRKDLGENPFENTPEVFRTTLKMLPHNGGERWIIFEKVKEGVMGTCTMYSSALLDKVGYLYQPTIYGWDDGLISIRSTMAGFVNGFLPHINIDHIDPGNTFYQKWKENHAGETARVAFQLAEDYKSGRRPIYEAP